MKFDTSHVSTISFLKKLLIVMPPLIFTFVAFQNCGQSPERSTSMTLNGSDSYNAYGSSSGSGSSSGTTPTPSNYLPIRFRDASVANGEVNTGTIRMIVQKISGAGPNLRACMTPYSTMNSSCINDSEFRDLRTSEGWSYDATTDTYSIYYDVSAANYPNQRYTSKLIASNGYRQLFHFSPISVKDSSVDNNEFVTKFEQKIVGVNANGLRACAALLSNRSTACLEDASFTVLATGAVNGWKYVSTTDTYSILDATVLTQKYPKGDYFVAFIHPNGLHSEYTFTTTTVLPPQ